ncbi:Similar to hypothetical protein [Podospora anserina S mat+]; acc. no. XP_001903708 [Pyronema omphalodes CBS 100304]|uniref:Uncharacterized protein n=1 Tax=Pyronema omphalodes (strain CBS 100304) TaxID=1076935 RepID=U4LQG5_PYROM|nr:Similar to hypothetical protein [Podospora anserina S mat+]; acc. no. XP_001903708 [Pyronema omphalodes CBS 100304]
MLIPRSDDDDGRFLLRISIWRGHIREWVDPPYQCVHLDGVWNDAVSAYAVRNGCCAFYRHHQCRDRLFTARNRSDLWLRTGHALEISAFICHRDCLDFWNKPNLFE